MLDRSIDRFEKVMLYFDETSNNGRWCNNRRNSVGGKFSTIMTIMTAHIEKAIILIKNETTNKNWINNLFRDVTNKSFNREYIY